jgi:hypothetical protein
MALAPRAQGVACIALAILCCGLGAIVYGEIDAFGGAPQGGGEAPPLPGAHTLPVPPSFTFPPIDTFAEIAERPLLSPNRRPPAAQAASDSELGLAGIVAAPKLRIAIIVHGKPTGISHVGEGQTIEGWTVQSIALDSVTLERSGQQRVLKLIDKPAVKSAAAKPPIDHSAPPRLPGSDE